MANTVNPAHVVTGKVRISYEHLFKPYASPGNTEAKYSCTVLVPKSDVATKQRIDAAIRAATEAGVSKSWNGVRPPMVAVPVYDGDGTRPSDGMPFGEECRGHWVFTASSKQAPQVVDLGLNPIINQSDVYSGMYARVSVNFFPYNSNGKKGIGCGLNNVQKLEDGEPLGGRTNAADDFADAAQQYAQPQYAQPYQQPQYQQPAYAPQPQYQPQYPAAQPAYAPQPAYPPAQPAIDPITGAPYAGVVMGLQPGELPF